MITDPDSDSAKTGEPARTAVILGATGTVGQGITKKLLHAGWRVIAVARDTARLDALCQEHPAIEIVQGSVESETAATELAARVQKVASRIEAVVASMNLPHSNIRLLDASTGQLEEILKGNLVVHHSAARAFLPLLAPGGRYVGIGGGMADFTFPGMGPVSICQAAQRNLYRFFAMETEHDDLSVVELILVSMIVDPAHDATADPKQIRADEVGTHVRAVLEQPEQFPGPILMLRSRSQVGQPES